MLIGFRRPSAVRFRFRPDPHARGYTIGNIYRRVTDRELTSEVAPRSTVRG
jgi:hypothetical protein